MRVFKTVKGQSELQLFIHRRAADQKGVPSREWPLLGVSLVPKQIAVYQEISNPPQVSPIAISVCAMVIHSTKREGTSKKNQGMTGFPSDGSKFPSRIPCQYSNSSPFGISESDNFDGQVNMTIPTSHPLNPGWFSSGSLYWVIIIPNR